MLGESPLQLRERQPGLNADGQIARIVLQEPIHGAGGNRHIGRLRRPSQPVFREIASKANGLFGRGCFPERLRKLLRRLWTKGTHAEPSIMDRTAYGSGRKRSSVADT